MAQDRVHRSLNKPLLGFFGVFGFFVLLFVGLLIASPIVSHTTEETVTVTIEDKERVNTEDESYYLVWTQVQNEDGSETPETFKVSDDLFQGKFNASDTYGRLKLGETYEVMVNGWRIGFFSSYRNILEVEEAVTG